MDMPSSSEAPPPSSPPPPLPKFVTPDDEIDAPMVVEPSSSGLGGGEGDKAQTASNGTPKKQKMVLNEDSDIEGGDNDELFDDAGPTAPVSREDVEKAQERRSKDRCVTMSIGVQDESDEVETEEERRAEFAQRLRNIRKQKQEDFDLEYDESEAVRQHVTKEVGYAMMFQRDNHLDYEPILKKKMPKIIEGYLWGAIIGNGSYGKVKEALDIYTLTRRAIKIMKYEKLRKISNGWENIRCEMSILRRLNHKNVIKLVEIFNLPEKGKVYMVFEYCIGSVQQLIEVDPAKRISVGEAHAIFVELCHGLNYLHSKRVAHKDIKPGNMLLSINLTVKICDFGVAEQISIYQSDGRCTKVNGTPKFQPPECVYGNHEFFDGYKADMWSAGITLYNLVSGQYPFERPVLLKLYECIGTEPVVMPTNVELSKDLKDFLFKLLEKDFNKRYSSLEAMTHPWFLSTFPEDQGLGRMMERMRTGDRPLTMMPSLTAMYDEPEPEIIVDQDGNEMYLSPPALVCGGELDSQTFAGFQYLGAVPSAAPASSSQNHAVMNHSDEPIIDGGCRRPSSRSMPTAPPPSLLPSRGPSPMHFAPGAVAPQAAGPSPPPPPPPQGQGAQPDGGRQRGRRGGKRSLFSCIFRSRTDST